jgi:hypothetical protein
MTDKTQELKITPKRAKKPTPWYLLTGLILGFILGAAYARVVNPVVYENTEPSSLHEDYKETYRSTIARVYAVTGNLQRARLRLNLLTDEDPAFTLGAQAQRRLAEGNSQEAHVLALLASAVQSDQPLQPNLLPTAPSELTSTPPAYSVPTHTLPVPTTNP